MSRLGLWFLAAEREEPMSSGVYAGVIFTEHAVMKFRALGYAEWKTRQKAWQAELLQVSS